jgi:hypothetical protein
MYHMHGGFDRVCTYPPQYLLIITVSPKDAGLFDSGSRLGQTFPYTLLAVHSLSQTCPTLARAELGA